MVRYSFVVAKQTTEENTEKSVYKVALKHGDGHNLTLKSESASIFNGFPVGSIITVTVEPMNTLDEFATEEETDAET